jgi:polyribonucleotide nucleotidyltransferase
VKVGDQVDVKCVEYDPMDGKTRLSLKQMTPPPEGFVPRPPRPSGPRPGGHHGGPRRGPPRR